MLSFFLLLFLWACRHSKPELVTIVFLDPEWSQPEVLPEMAGKGTKKARFLHEQDRRARRIALSAKPESVSAFALA